MKTYFKVFLFSIACIAMASCKCSMKVVVTGNPGTEIYRANGEKVATISRSGSAEFKLSCDSYDACLLTRNPMTGQNVPMALDYKKCNRHDAMWCAITTLPTVYVGEVVFLLRSQQLSHQYKYKYLRDQKTNEDLPIVELQNPQPVKVLGKTTE